MEDLETIIQRLSDLGRESMIRRLIHIDAQAKKLARGAGSRAKHGTPQRIRAENALSLMHSLGQIIYFLRRRLRPDKATAEVLALCDMLADKLRAKDQWKGECHPD
jgi:hypothetical protein